MRVTIVGGGLQGVELCWLAKQAGWEILLVDRRAEPSALRLADDFALCDVIRLEDAACREAAECIARTDIVIPALEDDAALEALGDWCARGGVPFAFDAAAYAVTSSKARSRELFVRCGTPIPQPFERGGAFPIIAKPSHGSGSRGVRLLRDEAEWRAYVPEGAEGWIVEAYCPGPSYSLEICGTPGAYRTFQTTALLMDDVFDCRGVLAPAVAPPAVTRRMEEELVKLAEALGLRGLMDLEVVLSPEGLRVLEIDARFPSQTPTAVWLSLGVNLAEWLVSCFLPYEPAPGHAVPRCVRYEHVCREKGELRFRGEHIMARVGPLRSLRDWYGADEALLGGDLRSDGWAATLMFAGPSPESVWERRNACVSRLREASFI